MTTCPHCALGFLHWCMRDGSTPTAPCDRPLLWPTVEMKLGIQSTPIRTTEQDPSTLPEALTRHCITCGHETGPVASWGRTPADKAVGPCCAARGDEYSPCLLAALAKVAP